MRCRRGTGKMLQNSGSRLFRFCRSKALSNSKPPTEHSEEKGVEGDDPENVLEEEQRAVQAQQALPSQVLAAGWRPLKRLPVVFVGGVSP